jgi:surface antigen
LVKFSKRVKISFMRMFNYALSRLGVVVLSGMFCFVLLDISKPAIALDTASGISVSRSFSLSLARYEHNFSRQRFASNQSTEWKGQKISKLAVDKPQPAYQPSGQTVVQSNLEIYNTQAGNRYIPGQCTWYAYNRRVELGLKVGSFWGNAGSWQFNARAGGYRVDNSPTVGSIIEWPGHVAIVEKVDAKKNRVYISEMNYLWAYNYHEAWVDNANQQVYIH